jgi:cyclophilin family peptidyl-prolyl cis-trans isomerase/HEAT repeat protein
LASERFSAGRAVSCRNIRHSSDLRQWDKIKNLLMDRNIAIRLFAGIILVFSIAAQTIEAQSPADRPLLEAEQQRDAGVPVLLAAIASGDTRSQMLAARALGRLENPAYRDSLVPLMHSPDPKVRRAAAGAIAQMRAPFAWASLLQAERDASVRAAIFEAIGRAKPPADDAETLLAPGLKDTGLQARAGAARGFESLFRLNSKPPRQPAATTIAALHEAFAANSEEEIRELILLAMHGAGDHDAATLASAIADPSPRIRRLAVSDTKTWVRDSSPIVRYEALRVAPSCERAAAALSDPNAGVALEAVDVLGSQKCDAGFLTRLLAKGHSWRIRAHALTGLAAIDPARARDGIAAMVADPTWQVRVYVAKAARIVNDSATLAKLARDENPNVAIAAMTTTDDATRALASEHSGLILAGAEHLKNAPDLNARLPQLISTFNRLTNERHAMTVRDPRLAVLTRIGETEDRSTDDLLREALHDRDPAIAAMAARILTERTGATVVPQTTRLPVPTIPPAEYIRGLTNAMARITMHGLGTITVDLLTDEAPVTVAVFAQLAEAHQYNGLTFHRVEPNFVIQGGSPGADEYDARSRDFFRDEVGFARNTRGTIGISTRGRDTGDAQIFFNLVDNFRLDRDYTVMAKVRDGLAVMDRVQEGDMIDRIEIIRRKP